MRYGQGIWCRYGVEEQVIVELQRRHQKSLENLPNGLAKWLGQMAWQASAL